MTHIVNTSDSTVQNTSPYTVLRDGWLNIYIGGASSWTVYVNDIRVHSSFTSSNANVPDLREVVPVSAGDVVTWTTPTRYDGSDAVIDFYPCK